MESTLSTEYDEFINLDAAYKSLLRSSKALKKKVKRDKKELKQALREYEEMDRKSKVQLQNIKEKYKQIRHSSKIEKKEIKNKKYIKKHGVTQRALNNITSVTFTNNNEDATRMQVRATRGIVLALDENLRKFRSVKFSMIAEALLHNPSLGTRNTYTFRNRNKIIHINEINNLQNIIQEQFTELQHRIEESNLEGSGYEFINYEMIRTTIVKNTNMQGSSYIELPKFIKDKHAVVNVKNTDDYCFVWAVLSALYPAKSHSDRVTNYRPYVYNLNLWSLDFPMQIKNIDKFERANNISINVFGYYLDTSNENDSEHFYPLYNTKINSPIVVDLLYIESEDVNENYQKKYHYAWIKNFKGLVHSSLNSNDNYEIICKRCMIGSNKSAYDKHLVYCKTGNSQCIMPTIENKRLYFKNYLHKCKHHLAVYGDFESVIEKGTKKHIPSSVAFCSVGDIN